MMEKFTKKQDILTQRRIYIYMKGESLDEVEGCGMADENWASAHL